MFVIPGDNIVFFDVDNTLIMWDPPEDQLDKAVDLPMLESPYGQDFVKVVPHKAHLTMIQRHYQLGNTVVVWSKSGPRWAEHVVKFFNLQDYVHAVCGKPSCFYDDLKPEEFMVERRYFTNKD